MLFRMCGCVCSVLILMIFMIFVVGLLPLSVGLRLISCVLFVCAVRFTLVCGCWSCS